MPTEIKLPNLGDGIDTGDVLERIAQRGQKIETLEFEEGAAVMVSDKGRTAFEVDDGRTPLSGRAGRDETTQMGMLPAAITNGSRNAD